MRPLSSVFGLRLQTAVKIICKSFLVLVTITLTLNLYNIDYQGPRRESGIALGLVLLFFALMTGSGFAGHSGANRESLVLVVLSLCFLIVAILHWLALGIMSMQKSDPQTMWLTERDYESSDPSTGVSLVVTLICFLLVFAYFVGCVTIICSYSSEMYDEDRFGDFEEEEGEEEESMENNENAD